MKKLVLFTLFSFFLTTILQSCTKNSSSVASNNVIGKWLISKRVNRTTCTSNSCSGQSRDTTITFNDGSYFDFRNDGKVYVFNNHRNVPGWGMGYDTSSYSVTGSIITFNNSTPYTIENSTSNNLIIHNVSNPSGQEQYDGWIYFYK